MPHNYDLRKNPRRRVSFSPPWPNSKRFGLNNQNRNMESETTMNTSDNSQHSHHSSSSVRVPQDMNQDDLSQQGAHGGMPAPPSNFERPPPFIPQPASVRPQPTHFQYQRVPTQYPPYPMGLPSSVPLNPNAPSHMVVRMIQI